MRLSASGPAVLLAGALAAGAARDEAACAARGSLRPELLLLQRSQRRGRAAGTEPEEGRRRSPLCSSEVVGEACADLRDDDDPSDGRISKQMAMDGLAVNASMAGALWGALGFGADESVACADLCQAAVGYVGRIAQLPPSNDRACYRTASGGVACDLDVSLGQLKKMRFDGDLPKHRSDDREMGQSKKRHFGGDLPSRLSDDRAMSLLASQALRQLTRVRGRDGSRALDGSLVWAGPVAYTVDALAERLANAFHVYPAPRSSAAPLGARPLAAQAACLTSAARTAQKAKVWVSTALSKVRRRETRAHLKKWFGADAAATRKEVLRVLSSIDAVMAGFRHVLLPDSPETCDGDTYAFVMHDGIRGCDEAKLLGAECQTDAAGRKVVYLCDLYCKSSEKVQVETMTHESSHHLPADTDDVPPEPYGRQWCLKMASSRPWDALRNADNYCFYVNDVVQGLGGSPGAPRRCPSAASGTCDATPCECDGDEVKAGEAGCFRCAARCPSAESWSCGDSDCQCGPGAWREVDDGCYYCEADAS